MVPTPPRLILVITLGAVLAGCTASSDAATAPGADTPPSGFVDTPSSEQTDGEAHDVDEPDPGTGGLSAAGSIVRDSSGVPHVRAATTLDALRLQGYATARDRLYQMELVRRRALGRRAEVLGETFYASDLQSRALRFGDWASRTEDALVANDPDLLAAFVAYVEGVNTWRAEALSGRGGAAARIGRGA